jgi:dTDP-D-glucose 4,6-dehydratase
MRVPVSGGAAFIVFAVIRHLILNTRHKVLNVDSSTYAGNLQNISSTDSDLDIHWPNREKKLPLKDNLLQSLAIEKSVITANWQHL